jgi:hypothetical protein
MVSNGVIDRGDIAEYVDDMYSSQGSFSSHRIGSTTSSSHEGGGASSAMHIARSMDVHQDRDKLTKRKLGGYGSDDLNDGTNSSYRVSESNEAIKDITSSVVSHAPVINIPKRIKIGKTLCHEMDRPESHKYLYESPVTLAPLVRNANIRIKKAIPLIEPDICNYARMEFVPNSIVNPLKIRYMSHGVSGEKLLSFHSSFGDNVVMSDNNTLQSYDITIITIIVTL